MTEDHRQDYWGAFQSTPKGRELASSYKPSPYQVRKRLPTKASQEREGLWLTQISPPPPGCFPGLTAWRGFPRDSVWASTQEPGLQMTDFWVL